MSRLADAVDAVRFARTYTTDLLAAVDPADWFRTPAGAATHVAWQVGHLAMAQYRLTMLLVRGARPGDDDLIHPTFLKTFGRESVPSPDASTYPAPAAIRATFDAVHLRLLADLPGLPESELDSPPVTPSRVAATKLECVRWCAAHEMLHAGQIGLLRRLFGRPPVW